MSDHEHHESHSAAYVNVFIALCVFTAISVVADVVHLPKLLLFPVVLAVATAKALCVMLWFMHLKFERAWKYLLLPPTFILATGMMFALFPDVGGSYYVREVPQFQDDVQAEHAVRMSELAAAKHGGSKSGH